MCLDFQYENAEGTFKTKEATESNKNKYIAVSYIHIYKSYQNSSPTSMHNF